LFIHSANLTVLRSTRLHFDLAFG